MSSWRRSRTDASPLPQAEGSPRVFVLIRAHSWRVTLRSWGRRLAGGFEAISPVVRCESGELVGVELLECVDDIRVELSSVQPSDFLDGVGDRPSGLVGAF